jgi:hypothetical protein
MTEGAVAIVAVVVGAAPALLIAVMQLKEARRTAERAQALELARLRRDQADQAKWLKSERYVRILRDAYGCERALRSPTGEISWEEARALAGEHEIDVIYTRFYDPHAVADAVLSLEGALDELMARRPIETAERRAEADALHAQIEGVIAAMRADLAAASNSSSG